MATASSGRAPRGALLVVCLLAAAWLLAYSFGDRNGLTFGGPGTLNFVQYWSAFRVLEEGGNPYDGATMHAAQAAIGQIETRTNLMWNPPWTAVLLSPLGVLSFPAAAALWAFLSILMLCGIALMGPEALGRPQPSLLVCAAATMCFYPVLECLVWGQASIFLAFWFVVFLLFVQRRNLFAAGLAAVPLTVKPHLFFLLAIPALLWFYELPAKEKKSFLAGSLGGLAIVVAATALRWPYAIGWWLDSLRTTPTGPGVVALETWKTATIATYLREALAHGDIVPQWPMWAIPLSALAGTALWFMRSKREVRWSEVAPPLVCLSLALAAYGWLYDQSVLLVCNIALVCDAVFASDRRRGWALLAALVAIQLTAVWVGSRPGSAQADFVWLPWAMLAAWIAGARLRRSPVPAAAS